MYKCNQDIRNEIREAGLKLYQVAYACGCNDGNFSRKLRRELSNEQKETIRQIITFLRDGEKNEGR
jgi:hypothetical protein